MSVIVRDGNAFAIMGVGRRELINTGRENEVDQFIEEMTSGDYDNLLRTFFTWFPDAAVAG
jgi:hypothetical protein